MFVVEEDNALIDFSSIVELWLTRVDGIDEGNGFVEQFSISDDVEVDPTDVVEVWSVGDCVSKMHINK